MTDPDAQKRKERLILDRFAATLPDFPAGNIRHSESPDFLIDSPEGVIGVEVRQIFHPGSSDASSPQAQESLRQRAADLANELHRRNGGPPVHVNVRFRHDFNLTKGEVESLAWLLADTVGEARPSEGQIINLTSRDETAPPPFQSVLIGRVTTEPRWLVSGSGWIPSLCQDDLQRELESKEAKIADYRERCGEIWLLLVADNFRISGSVDLPQAVLAAEYTTGFDRVFLFRTFESQTNELTARRPTRGYR